MEWGYLKYKVRQLAKRYSVDKAKKSRAKRNKLELRVKELEVYSLQTRKRQLKNIMTVNKSLRAFTVT